MNITLEKYSKEYEKIVADYVGDFFGYHSKLSGFEKIPAIEQSLENIIQWTSEKHALYVILLEKRPVGFIHIWYKGDNVAWIEDLYVEEKHRRQGIGSFAIREAEKILSCNPKYTALCIDVVPQNKNAIDLYYELGYDSLSIITIRKELKENNRNDTVDFLGKKFKI